MSLEKLVINYLLTNYINLKSKKNVCMCELNEWKKNMAQFYLLFIYKDKKIVLHLQIMNTLISINIISFYEKFQFTPTKYV